MTVLVSGAVPRSHQDEPLGSFPLTYQLLTFRVSRENLEDRGLRSGIRIGRGENFIDRPLIVDVFQHATVRPADYHVPPLGRLLLMSSVVGFVIGALVPHWYPSHTAIQ